MDQRGEKKNKEKKYYVIRKGVESSLKSPIESGMTRDLILPVHLNKGEPRRENPFKKQQKMSPT